ncbi:MAG: ABC transporter substrate-binding protein [Actinomycetota bacterium]
MTAFKRTWPQRLAALGLLGALLLSACSVGEGSDDESSESVEQKLVVGADEDGYTTEGAEADVGQYPLNVNIFESLVRMDENYEIEPSLATKWEFVAPNTWRFELREGVEFHDGTPFDAEAVKYSFDRVAKTGGGTPGFEKGGTKVVDDYTVEITPQFDNRRLLEQLVHPSYSIIAPDSNPGEEPIGTGPFSLVEYKRQQRIVVERYDGYWGEPAQLEEITFSFLPDPNARRLALEAGEVDLVLDVAREAIPDLESKGFLIAESQPGAYSAMYLNISGQKGYTILQDSNVRHAIGYAIDRETLIGGIFEGLATDEQTMVPSRLLGESGASEVEGFTYDQAEAERLLDESGWTMGSGGVREKDGEPLRLELINGFPSASDHGAVPEYIQGQLGDVGIEVEIVKTPDTASYEERLATGEGDIWMEQGSQNDANPLFLPALLFWSVGLFGDIGYQQLFAPGAEFDALIEDALASPDPEEVKQIVGDAMHVLIDQEAVVIPLAGLYRLNVLSDQVQGFQTHPSALQIQYNSVSMGAGDG